MSQKWYYLNAALEKVGPVSLQALKIWAADGLINSKTTLMTEDGKMFEAASLQDLAPFLLSPVPVTPPPKKVASPASSVSRPIQSQTPVQTQTAASSSGTYPVPPPTKLQVEIDWNSNIIFPTPLESTGETSISPHAHHQENSFHWVVVAAMVLAGFVCLSILGIMISTWNSNAALAQAEKPLDRHSKTLKSPIVPQPELKTTPAKVEIDAAPIVLQDQEDYYLFYDEDDDEPVTASFVSR